MRAAQQVRVLIVDDHRMFADGLAAALDREPDIDVVGTASLISAPTVVLRRTAITPVIPSSVAVSASWSCPWTGGRPM